MTVTPALAKQWIAKSTGNFRRIVPARVEAYRTLMAAGEWDLNGVTIKFDSGDVLIDGQHRLLACMKAGVPFDTLVCFDVQSDAANIDGGKPRTHADWLRHLGFGNANNLAATIRHVIGYEREMWNSPRLCSFPLSIRDVQGCADSHDKRLQDAIRLSARPKGFSLSKSCLASILFIGSGDSTPSENETAMWFAEALSKGEDLTQQDAVLHLRNRLIDSQSNPSRAMTRDYARALITIAWNKTVSGEPCKVLKLSLAGPRPHKFPTEILVAE